MAQQRDTDQLDASQSLEDSLSPPYWQTEHDTESPAPPGRKRAYSRQKISLVDNTEPHTEQSRACWAQSAYIEEHVVIAGGFGIGSYVVYSCVVITTTGSKIKIRKRYSEFDKLREDLIRTFPNSKGALPSFPPKSAFHKFEDKFLKKRIEGLGYFINCVVCNPEFAASPILKDFLFG